MQKDKNKKKTLTISSSFTKKFNPSSYGKTSKKSYIVDRKRILKLHLNQIKTLHQVLVSKIIKIQKILIENLLSNKLQKIHQIR